MTLMRMISTALSAAVLACMAAPALATPVTYTFTATGSGTLGGASFQGASFTISALTDTSLIASTSVGYSLNQTPALTGVSLAISGFSGATFTGASRFFSAFSGGVGGVGFGEAPVSPAVGLDYLNILDNAFIGYDMRSDIGPITVATADPTALSQFVDIGTSLGNVTFRSISNISFTAATSAVPEPSSLAMMLAAAVVGLVAARRRRA